MSPPNRPSRWTFTLVSAGGVMMTVDVTVVNVAVPAIARDLGTGLDTAQWIVSIYSLAFGALLLSAGALSDRIGRRGVYLAGMLLFTAGSAACGLAPDPATLIAARAAQGLGGSLVFAPALALLAAAYPDGGARRRAIAGFAAVSAVAGAAGPVLGGGLVHLAGWRSVFLVNVPIGALVAVGALLRMPPAPPGGERGRLDPLGALLAAGTLLALHYPLIAAGEAGWRSPLVAGSAVCGLVLAAGLVASQRRGNGLIDLALLRTPGFAAAAGLGFLARMTGLGVLTVATFWLQQTYRYTPVQAGLALLPLTGALCLTGLVTGRLQSWLSPGALVALGFACHAAGLTMLGLAPGRLATGVGFAVLGAGGAVIFPSLMYAAVAAVPPERTGTASGLSNACYPLGTAAGVAVFGAVFTRYGFTAVCLTAAALCVAAAGAARCLEPVATSPAPAAPDRTPAGHPGSAR